MRKETTLPDDQQEDSDDLAGGVKRFSAVVTTTDWTVETIVEQLRKGNIELNPDFQRREAWLAKRKSQFIESLILGVPVPQLVLAERKDKRGSFIVIDGKQRLSTLRQFCSDPDDERFEHLTLSGLSVRGDLNGVDFEQLTENVALDADLSAFENATIRTAVIKNWPDEDFLYMVFLRLNTGSVPLSPQELRQALHPGSFSKFVDEYSTKCEPLAKVLGLSGPDFRMRDAELVIRFFAFHRFISEYSGNLKAILDTTTKFYNERWEKEQKTITAEKEAFEKALNVAIKVFGINAFKKWNGKTYERQFNRAVFDALALYFARDDVAKAAALHSKALESAFKKLCEESEEFRSSVESTTKSIEAIHTRLNLWGERLNKTLKLKVTLPKLRGQRIHWG